MRLKPVRLGRKIGRKADGYYRQTDIDTDIDNIYAGLILLTYLLLVVTDDGC